MIFKHFIHTGRKAGGMRTDTFQALADPTRRRILELLADGDLTAGELADHFDITKPSMSHHLNILKAASLVTSERDGQKIVYHLNMTVMQEGIKWFMDLTKRSSGEEG